MPRTQPTLEDSLRRVSALVEEQLASVPREIFDLSSSPVNFLGKAVRARFTLLAGDALELPREQACRLAAAAELTHTASLLHDDCIDLALTRRGLPTLNDKLGVNAAILVGDLVVSMAFEMAEKASPHLAPELVRTVRRMTEGALLEENWRGRRLSEAEAARITSMKTGALFRWCGLAACSLAGRPDLLEDLAFIGEEAGAVFQAVDDVLDFEGDPAACGKETLKDVKLGNFTLPLILALNDPAAGPAAEKLVAAVSAAGGNDLGPALELAALVKERGFAAAARTRAAARIAALEPRLAGLPSPEGAAALKTFLFSFGERRR